MTEPKAPVTVTATEVNRVVIGHKMGAVEWMRLSDEAKASRIAVIRADAVAQITQLYPGHLYAFTEPTVESQGSGLTVAGDRTLDRGITVSCPVFVFAPGFVGNPVDLNPEERIEGFLAELNALLDRYGLLMDVAECSVYNQEYDGNNALIRREIEYKDDQRRIVQSGKFDCPAIN